MAIAAIGSQSLPAVNAMQFYMTVSQGSKDVAIYVDDKAARPLLEIHFWS